MLLILSIFPGLDLLGRAFEEVFEGRASVVRGPDPIWGGDILQFKVPPGVFQGIIGGPPCQMYSPFGALNAHRGYAPTYGNLIPEFERCVAEAQPDWFIMEEVERAPVPRVPGYKVFHQVVSNRNLGDVQNRVRRISFGTPEGAPLRLQYLSPPARNARTVTAGSGGGKIARNSYSVADACRLQGLPADFMDKTPFTVQGKVRAVANGVPMSMGRAIAKGVMAYLDLKALRSHLSEGGRRAATRVSEE